MTAYRTSPNLIFHKSRPSFPGTDGAVTGAPKVLLRLEGLLTFTTAAIAYKHLGFDWKLFGLLFLAPDLSMFGYFAGPAIGATAYNLAHTYALAFILGAFGLWLPQPLLISVALIFAAHIGFDRMLGYGLKYSTGFGDTHLGRADISLTLSSSSGQ